MKHVAGIIVVRSDGAVLLQHRDNKVGIFYPDHWCYPGGVVEEGESFEAAARRELFEETGYVATSIFPLETQEYVRSDGVTMCAHPFWAIYDKQQEIQCLEGQEMSFISSDEIEGKKFIPTQKNLVLSAIAETLRK